MGYCQTLCKTSGIPTAGAGAVLGAQLGTVALPLIGTVSGSLAGTLAGLFSGTLLCTSLNLSAREQLKRLAEGDD